MGEKNLDRDCWTVRYSAESDFGMEATTTGISQDVSVGQPKQKIDEPDIKIPQVKIGQLTLKNDFLESALTPF